MYEVDQYVVVNECSFRAKYIESAIVLDIVLVFGRHSHFV